MLIVCLLCFKGACDDVTLRSILSITRSNGLADETERRRDEPQWKKATKHNHVVVETRNMEKNEGPYSTMVNLLSMSTNRQYEFRRWKGTQTSRLKPRSSTWCKTTNFPVPPPKIRKTTSTTSCGFATRSISLTYPRRPCVYDSSRSPSETAHMGGYPLLLRVRSPHGMTYARSSSHDSSLLRR